MDAKKAVYIGTFDPFTRGHMDVVERAGRLFSVVIVGIGKNSTKQVAFSVEERVEMILEACKHLNNIQVAPLTGLAVNFAEAHSASVLIRGLRTEADYVYEMQMATMNRSLAPSLETIFIPTKQSFSHISSSLVKEVAALGGNVEELVPESVNQRLLKKYR